MKVLIIDDDIIPSAELLAAMVELERLEKMQEVDRHKKNLIDCLMESVEESMKEAQLLAYHETELREPKYYEQPIKKVKPIPKHFSRITRKGYGLGGCGGNIKRDK